MKRFIQCMVWGCGVLLVGCVTPPAPVADGDGVAIERLSVSSPGSLTIGATVQVSVRYHLVTDGSALLRVYPYREGDLVPGHRTNVAIPVTRGAGEAACWVSFATDASVDELRVSLVTLPRYRVLAEGRRDVDLTWR